MYVNVESALERKIYLSVLTNTATARAFNIRVSQLQEAVAPDGCLQYHTETAGFVQSFNYADKSEVVDYRRPSYFVSSPLTVLDGDFRRDVETTTTTTESPLFVVLFFLVLLTIVAAGMQIASAQPVVLKQRLIHRCGVRSILILP